MNLKKSLKKQPNPEMPTTSSGTVHSLFIWTPADSFTDQAYENETGGRVELLRSGKFVLKGPF